MVVPRLPSRRQRRAPVGRWPPAAHSLAAHAARGLPAHKSAYRTSQVTAQLYSTLQALHVPPGPAEVQLARPSEL